MVVFDLDDTLYFEREFVVSGFGAVERRLMALGHPASGACALFLSLLDRDGSGRVFDDGLSALGIEPSPGLVSDLVDTYRHHVPTLTPGPGIQSLLDELAADGIRLGLITDGAVDIQTGKLVALGLDERFEIVLPTDALGPDRVGWKPSTRPFEAVETETGLTGSELVYVGDNPDKDFIGAAARGWHCIRYRRPEQLRAERPTPTEVTEAASPEALRSALRSWRGQQRIAQ